VYDFVVFGGKKILYHVNPLQGNDHETNMFRGSEPMRNNRGTVGNSVFYAVCATGLYNEDTSQVAVSCKGVCEMKTRRLV
jgi:hypothetical protein